MLKFFHLNGVSAAVDDGVSRAEVRERHDAATAVVDAADADVGVDVDAVAVVGVVHVSTTLLQLMMLLLLPAQLDGSSRT